MSLNCWTTREVSDLHVLNLRQQVGRKGTHPSLVVSSQKPVCHLIPCELKGLRACCLRDSILAGLWAIWKDYLKKRCWVAVRTWLCLRTAPILVPRLAAPEVKTNLIRTRSILSLGWRKPETPVGKELGNSSVTIAPWGMVSLGKCWWGSQQKKYIKCCAYESGSQSYLKVPLLRALWYCV